MKQTHYKLGMPMDLGKKNGLLLCALFMEGPEGAEVKALN